MNQILVLLLVFGVVMFPTATTAAQRAQMETAGRPAEQAPVPIPVLRNIEFVGAATTNPGWKPSSTFGVWMPEHRKGDLLLAFISSGYAHAGGPPAGWTLVRQDVKAHDDLAVQTYWRIAEPWESERPRYDWPLVSLEKPAWQALGAATVLAFRNVDPENPIAEAAVKAQTADSFRIDCPSVRAPLRGMLVCGWVLDDPDTVTAPAGMTQVSNFMIRGDDSHAVAFAPASGRTGIRSAIINDVKGGSDDFAQAVALNPLPAPAAPGK
jgi:hypothetical protein